MEMQRNKKNKDNLLKEQCARAQLLGSKTYKDY